MAKKTAAPHICLICWDQAKAAGHAAELKEAGYRVTPVTASVRNWIGYVRDLAVDAIALDLDRLPSSGRQVGLHLRNAKSTRHLPLVYLGGEPSKVERVRIDLPGATFAAWARAKSAIQQAIATPITTTAKTTAPITHLELSRKLGLKSEVLTVLWGDDGFLEDLLAEAPTTFSRSAGQQLCLCLAVTRRAADIDAVFDMASATYKTGSSIWIIHPKQSGRYAADFNQNDVRAIGLAHGWVDYRVCSVDSDWSGLKFARRKPGQPLPPRSMKHAAGSTSG